MRRIWSGGLAVAVVAAGMTAAGLAERPAVAENVTVSADPARTGWDPAEPGLAPSLVSAGDFGQLFNVAVDGSVYAQPLVIGDMVVVTTERAKAYGLDAATGAVRWSRTFGAPFQAATIGCGDLTPDLGQTSTPAYDPATGTVYLTTKIADGPTPQQPHWYLHGISAADGTEQPGFPVILQGTADNDPTVVFDPFVQLQRPGLLLADGVVYIGFGAHCDIGAYRGWVIAVRVSGQPQVQSVWTAEAASGGGAGIWQSGGGLASDGSDVDGNPRIFLATGNGVSPPVGPGGQPPGWLGDTVARIGLDGTGHLTARDFFAPTDVLRLGLNDVDLGAGGPVALPDAFGTPSRPHLLVEDGKDGRLFLLDRDNLGGRAQGPGGTDAVVQTVGPFNGVWGHPAVYPGEGGWVYYVENSGPLRAYARAVTTDGDPRLSAVGASTGTFGYTSGSPIVTSDGTRPGSALVWVIYSVNGTGFGGQLRAYDAVPAAGRLRLRWSSSIGYVSKFSLPATGSGRVYVGTRDGRVRAFGRPATTALAGPPVDFGTVPVGSTGTGVVHLVASRQVTVSAAAAPAPFGAAPAGLPRTLAAGAALDVPVQFTPTAAGSATAALTVSAGTGSVLVDLHGTGTTPGLAAAPPTLAFGTVPTGVTKTLTAIVSNTGTTAETVTAVTPPAGVFTATGLPTVGQAIQPQQSIAVSVSFLPTAAGAATGSFQLRSTGSTLTVPLSGTGQTGQGHLQITPAGTDFGNVVVGASRTQVFELENTGNVPVTITKAKAPTGVFSAANPLPEGISLDPEEVVRQEVTVTPTVPGPVSATYEVTADDGQGAQYETLTATGVTATMLPAPTGPGWTRNGTATQSGGTVLLTAARAYSAGSVFANTAVPSDGLEARFTATIGGGSGADGMTFTLADPADPATSLGRRGGSLGYGGIPSAIAVTLDTFQNTTDPGPNFVGVAIGRRGSTDALVHLATSTDVPPLAGQSHAVEVNVYSGRLRVLVDGDLKIDTAVALPALVRPGFTAATGGRTDRHAVSNVVITTPA
jgi:hypothetical protein